MNQHATVISVITVVYNGVLELEGTIKSVAEQTYPSIEYIIVDGASNDGTLEIIKKCKQFVKHFVSEPDQGIYDAMNKGLKLATGDFVIFMNCGDRFYAENTLERMMQYYTSETDALYGETMMVDQQHKPIGIRSEITTQKVPAQLHWRDFQKGQIVCHQAFLLRRSLASDYILGNLCADIDWMIKALKIARRTVNTNLVVATFQIGGTSQINFRRSITDRFIILRKHFGLMANLFNHLIILLRGIWFKIIRIGKASY